MSGYMGYDVDLVRSLVGAMQRSRDGLDQIRTGDPTGQNAMSSVAAVTAMLDDQWIPFGRGLLACQAMTGYRPATIDDGDLANRGLKSLIIQNGWRTTTDPVLPPSESPSSRAVPQIGAGNLVIPSNASVTTFDIPVWDGAGVTRIQYFIDDDSVCLSGTGPDIACGHGDDRGFVSGGEISDYNVATRVQVVLDHETGTATVVSYATHGDGADDVAALPVELTIDGPIGLPKEYPSQLRVWTGGEGDYWDSVNGNVVFDYLFVNSETPKLVAGAAPAIHGAIRVQQGPNGTVSIDGTLAQYPSVEIIRDQQLPNGYKSTLIFVKAQESGGPLNLYESGESFAVAG